MVDLVRFALAVIDQNERGTNLLPRIEARAHSEAMSKHAVSPYQLKIQALFILYKLAHHRQGQPYDRSWTLRFLLAFLYSQSEGEDRSSFDGYWKAATRPKKPDEADGAAAYVRGMKMKNEANGICLAVGEQPKEIQDRFWDELVREAYASRGEKVRILK